MSLYCVDTFAPQQVVRGACAVSAHTDGERARPVRMGVLDLAPPAQFDEPSALRTLREAVLPIRSVQIRFAPAADASLLTTFERAIQDKPLDGLVLTGTLPRGVPTKRLRNWEELADILEYARSFIPSILGLGVGRLELSRALGTKYVEGPDSEANHAALLSDWIELVYERARVPRLASRPHRDFGRERQGHWAGVLGLCSAKNAAANSLSIT